MKHKLKWDEIIGIFFMLISVILLGISVFLSGMMNCLPWGWQISPLVS